MGEMSVGVQQRKGNHGEEQRCFRLGPGCTNSLPHERNSARIDGVTKEVCNMTKEVCNMTKEIVGGLIGHFGWDFGQVFFIETEKGNFIWSDPEYGGDGSIRPYAGSLKSWLKSSNLPYVRDKGKHFIREYCGDFTYIP